MKQCIECNQTKDDIQFTKSKNKYKFRCNDCYRQTQTQSQAKYRAANKDFIRQAAKEQRIKARESRAIYNRQWKLDNPDIYFQCKLAKYNITVEQYNKMLEQQDYVCKICRCKDTLGKRLAIDHDHACCPSNSSCGKCVRGLLCSYCNLGLGSFKDNLLLLEKAHEYLMSSSQAMEGWLAISAHRLG